MLFLRRKKIIKKQYMSEDISLNTVAAEVGMSASYFSTIFSREMNQTFVEYLTEMMPLYGLLRKIKVQRL